MTIELNTERTGVLLEISHNNEELRGGDGGSSCFSKEEEGFKVDSKSNSRTIYNTVVMRRKLQRSAHEEEERLNDLLAFPQLAPCVASRQGETEEKKLGWVQPLILPHTPNPHYNHLQIIQ